MKSVYAMFVEAWQGCVSSPAMGQFNCCASSERVLLAFVEKAEVQFVLGLVTMPGLPGP